MENFFDYQFNITKVLTPVAGKDDDRFGFLPLRQLDADCEVPFNVYLKVKHKDNSSIDFINCCHQSQIFQREWKLKLTELNITGVYYSIYEEGEVIKYLNNNLCVCLEKDNLRYEENIARICDVTLIWLRHFYVKNQARTGENLDFALKYIDGLWAMISKETIHGSFITDIWNYDQCLYAHSINVCLLGLAFVSYLDWPERMAKDFGLGALLHDIGMTEVPKKILAKSSPLTDDDWTIIKKHPAQGLHILKRFVDLSWDTLLMISQHHENGDGSGYPDGLELDKIHSWARILRIIDSYEAMTSNRDWRPAHIAKDALWKMRNDWENNLVYDTSYLKLFIKFLGGT